MQRAYLIRLIREALAREEAELGVDVEVLPGSVLLTGTLPSEERRTRAVSVVREVCQPIPVVNEIQLRPPGAAGAPEALP